MKTPDSDSPFRFTDTSGWSHEQIRERLAIAKQQAGWDNTVGWAQKWSVALEYEHQARPAFVLRLMEELLKRKVTITEFCRAYFRS